jgi:signal transduction histidine kinase
LTILTQDPVIDTVSCPVYITGLTIMDDKRSFDRMADLRSYFETGDTLWSSDGNQLFTKNTLPQDSGYVFDNHMRWDSLSSPYKLPIGLQLPYDQNYLQFSFANLCVLNRDKISFRYMLAGAEDRWVYAGEEPLSKNYFNLSPGAYTFRVATRGIKGQWGEPAEFSFRIFPPWWQTWWAYAIYVLFFLGVLRIYSLWRERKLRQEKETLEQTVEERTSELKASQAQLIQSEKMASLGELTAGIAHEIQNPLNFVNNFSELNRDLITELKEEIEKGDLEEVKLIATDIAANEEKIHHHGKRADAIVKGMLEHSRANKGEQTPTDLNALADEYLRLSYHGLRAKDKSFNADFRLELDPDLPKVNVVASEIGRVILNLVNNAFYAVHEKAKSGPEGYNPEVVISSKQTEKGIELSVKDNGNGIPEHIKEKIFQPFFTTKPTGSGTGLGLSLSYDIVKAHGGELRVESKEGQGLTGGEVGTIFTIQLPLS